jgi:hypothetical protein
MIYYRNEFPTLLSLTLKIEQANLYVEPLAEVRVVASALAESAALLLRKGREGGDRILEGVACGLRDRICRFAATGLAVLSRASEMRWVGGGCSQKDVFAFVYTSLKSFELMLLALHREDPRCLARSAELGQVRDQMKHLEKSNPWISSIVDRISSIK